MGVPAATQIRVFSPRDGDGGVTSWSLPAWVIGMVSFSVGQALGTKPSVVLTRRIASELKIQEGDEVEFEFLEIGERFKHPVTIRDRFQSDVTIHGALAMGIIASESIYTSLESDGRVVATFGLKSGKELQGVMQEMWAGMKAFMLVGNGVLFFDGASRNNPDGPSGYGYCVLTAANETGDPTDKDLVQGYGYYPKGTSNQMEYRGLVEGLTWALRLDLKRLYIKGDSELVIRQCEGTYQVNDPVLRTFHDQITSMVTEARDGGTEIIFSHVRREENQRADQLANMGIDLKSHTTTCNWDNINRQCARGF